MVGQVASLLRRRKLVFMGDPRVPLPLIHAEDLATAAIAAATCGRAVGEAFNVVNPEIVTQEQFFNTIASLVGAPLVTRHVPYRLAYTLGLAAEIAGHLFMSKHAPPVTRYRVFLFGYRRAYSVQKIQQLLSWQPRIAFADGIRQTAAWYRSQNHS